MLEFVFNPYSLMIKQPFLWLLNFEKLLFWPSHMELPNYQGECGVLYMLLLA